MNFSRETSRFIVISFLHIMVSCKSGGNAVSEMKDAEIDPQNNFPLAFGKGSYVQFSTEIVLPPNVCQTHIKTASGETRIRVHMPKSTSKFDMVCGFFLPERDRSEVRVSSAKVYEIQSVPFSRDEIYSIYKSGFNSSSDATRCRYRPLETAKAMGVSIPDPTQLPNSVVTFQIQSEGGGKAVIACWYDKQWNWTNAVDIDQLAPFFTFYLAQSKPF